MLFYRVCHRALLNSCPAGLFFYAGPYTVGGPTEEWSEEIKAGLTQMNRAHSHDRKHLSVMEEWHFRPPFKGDFLCGFSSPEKLTEWFAGFFEILYAADYVVRVWDVPPDFVSQGAVQSCALLSFLSIVKPVQTMDMDEFEKELVNVGRR